MSTIDTNPLISIIVPIYKVEAYLPKCLDSILSQTYTNLEIILVDDGSPDNCGTICDEYAAKDPRIKAIHQPNAGLSGARNKGLAICQGQYIAFVDSDDWVEPDYIEAMLEAAEENIIVHCGYYRQEIKQTLKICSDKLLEYDTVKLLNDYLTRNQIKKKYLKYVMWNKLFPKAVFAQLRFPQGRNYEDIYISIDILKAVPKHVILNKPLYHYRIRAGSINSTINAKNINDLLEALLKQEKDFKEASTNPLLIEQKTLNSCLGILASVKKNHIPVSEAFENQLKKDIRARYSKLKAPSKKTRIKYHLLMSVPFLYPYLLKIKKLISR